MATNYPNSLDNFTNPTSASPINSPSHSEQHANANDAIEAIEGELGTNPKGAKATVKVRLDDVDTAIATKAPIDSPTFTGTVTIPSGSAITGVPYLATANTFTGNNTFASPIVGFVGTGGTYSSAAVSAYNIIHLSQGMILINSQTGGDYNLATNTYYNSGWKYFESSPSTLLNFGNGNIDFNTAASGTAGNTITFTSKMKINNSGNVTINGFGASTVGLIVKGATSQTADYFQIQNSSGTVVVKADSSNSIAVPFGQISAASGLIGSGTTRLGTAGVTAYASAATSNGIIVRGAASQTAKLQEWQNSAGTVVASTSVEGNGYFQANLNAASIGAGNNIGGASLTASPWSAVTTVSIIRGYPSQSADLTKWQNSDGTVLSGISPIGQSFVQTTAPITASAISQSITAVSFTSTTATYTFSATEQTISIGEYVTVYGITPSGYNGTYQVTAVATVSGGTSYSFTVANTTNATVTVGTGYFFPSASVSISTKNKAHTGLIIKAVSGQTASVLELQNSLGQPATWFDSTGGMTASQAVVSTLYSGGFMNTGTLGYFNATTFSSSVIPVVVRGTTSQATDLTQWQNSSGTSLARISNTGIFVGGSFSSNGSQAAGTNIASQFGSTSATRIPMVVYGAASQTANLQEWQDSAGAVLSSISASGGFTVPSLTVSGDLTVNGTTTNINSTNLVIEDKNIVLGDTTTPTDITADGGGITLKGTTDKTFNWVDSTDSWTSSEHLNLASGKSLYLNGTLLKDATETLTNKTLTSPKINEDVAVTATATEINVLDGITSTTAELNILDGVTSTAAELNILDGVTSTAAELNILDGVTATALEINVLDGITSSTAEINILDGVTADYTELNILDGATLSTTELNYVDGVTSSIQTQIDTKAPLASPTFTGTVTIPANSAITGVPYLDTANTFTNSPQEIANTSTSAIQLILRTNSGQTADNFQIKNITNTVNFRIFGGSFGADGVASIGNATLPTTSQLYVQDNNAARVGLIIRGATSQTASLQEWHNSAGSALAYVDSSGTIRSAIFGSLSAGLTTMRTNYDTNGIGFQIGSAGQKGLVIRGFASQTENLQEWQNSSGTLLSWIHPAGYLTLGSATTIGGVLGISTGVSTARGIVVRGAASQSVNLQEWQNSAGGVIASIGPAGSITTNSNITQGTSGRTFIGGAADAGAFLNVGSATTTRQVIVARPNFATQSASLQEWQNSAGTVLSGINAAGQIHTGTTTSINGSITGTIISTTYVSSTVATFEYNGTSLVQVGQRVTIGDPYGNYSGNGFAGTWTVTAVTSNTFTVLGSGFSDYIVAPEAEDGTFTLSAAGSFVANTAVTTPVVVKGVTSQTANLQEWQNSAGGALLNIDSTGNLDIGAGSSNIWKIKNQTSAVMEWQPSQGFMFLPYGSSNRPVTIKGAASQTANLTEWQDSTGAVLSSISASGGFTIPSLTVSGDFTVNGTTTNINTTNLIVEDKNITIADVATPTDTTADGAGITIKGATDKTLNWVQSTGSFTSSEPFIINTNSTTKQNLIVKGIASQTANLQEWQNSAGNVIASVYKDGISIQNNETNFPRGLTITQSTNNIAAAAFIARKSRGTNESPVVVNTGDIVGAFGFTSYNGTTYPIDTTLFGAAVTDKSGSTISQSLYFTTGSNSNGNYVPNLLVYHDGRVGVGAGFGNITSTINQPSATLHIGSLAANTVVALVKGAASQSVSLQEWQNNSGTALASIGATGALRISGSLGYMGGGGSQLVFQAGNNAAYFTVTSLAGAYPSLIIRSITSQTSNLQQWQNSAGTIFSGINAAGQIFAGTTTSINGSTTTEITSAAFTSATVAVFTYGGTSLVQAGQAVTVAGVTGGTYNGTWTVTAVTSTTFTVLGSGFTDVAGTGGTFTLSAVGSFVSGTAAITPIVVRGAASQTANLQEWQNSAGTILPSIGPNGTMNLKSVSSANLVTFFNGTSGFGAGNISYNGIFNINAANMGFPYTASGATLSVNATSATVVPITSRGFASQTGDLQQWQNSAGTVLASVASGGGILANSFSAVNGIVTGSLSFSSISYNGFSNPAGILTNPTVVIRGIASQTGDLQQWRGSANTILAKVDVNGNFSAISKSFDIPHPTKENMRLRYASLEGNEHGIYVRGITKEKIIELPEYWTNLVDESTITVSLTSIGKFQKVYVEKIEGNKIYIGGRVKEISYAVFGERKDIDKLIVEY